MSEAPRLELHVAPGGDDAAPGSRERPLASLAAARDRLRRLRAARPGAAARVWLAGGRYALGEGLVLDARDSGTPAAPVCWRARPGERVVLSGGVRIPPQALHPAAPGDGSERIRDARARRDVRVLDLAALGIEPGRLARRGWSIPVPLAPLELWLGGRRLRRVRWPAHGTVRARFAGGALERLARRPVLRLPDAALPLPRRPEDVWIVGVLGKDWCWSANRLTHVAAGGRLLRLADRERGTLRRGWDYPVCFENALETLAVPGDYHLDTAHRRVHWLPPEGFAPGDAPLAASTLAEPLLRLEGAAHLRLADLVFELGRDRAVVAEGGRDVRLERCTVRRFGRGGIRLAGEGHVVRDCHVHDVGGVAIELVGGNPDTLEPAAGRVERCHVHDWGHWQRVYAGAVRLDGVGHVLRRSTLHDGPHLAIDLQGNDHRVEENEVFRVVTGFRDMGALYLNQGFRPLRRGAVVRRNLFRDLGGDADQVHAVYLDNATMGVSVEGNRFERIGSASHPRSSAVKCNGPAWVAICDNVFVDCPRPIEVDYFLDGWGRNRREDYLRSWRRELARAAPGSPHRRRYPELARFFAEDRFHPDTNRIEGNRIEGSRVSGEPPAGAPAALSPPGPRASGRTPAPAAPGGPRTSG